MFSKICVNDDVLFNVLLLLIGLVAPLDNVRMLQVCEDISLIVLWPDIFSHFSWYILSPLSIFFYFLILCVNPFPL